MAVVSVQQIPNDQEQSVSTNTERNDVLTYLVTCDSLTDTSDTALNAAGIPVQAATISAHTGTNSISLTVTNREARRKDNSPLHWLVRVTAASPTLAAGTNKSVVNLTVDGVEWSEPIYTDQTPAWIQNSAKTFFEPQPEETYYDEEISVEFTSNAVDLTNIAACRGCVNSGSVTMNVTVKGNNYTRTFAAKTLLLQKATYSIVLGDGAALWNIKYVFIYRVGTWARKFANIGLFCFSTATNTSNVVPCVDFNQQPTTIPMPLATNGTQLAFGSSPNFLTFDTKTAVSFTGLFTGLT